MAVLCKEIILTLANLHDGGTDGFFAGVTRALLDHPRKSRWLKKRTDLDNQQFMRYYIELVPTEWCFHIGASNAIKINRLQEIAPYCISQGKSVVLNDHFEIWDPRID